MGMDDPGRYITRPSVIILFLICVCLYLFVLPSWNNFSELADNSEETISPFQRTQNLGKSKKEEANNNANKNPGEKEVHEFVHGTKRYKLYEKKRLNFRKAESFCKKMDGRLAKTDNLDEMTRLTTLLRRAKMVSDELWIGVERKQWKRHAWQDKPHPPGMNPEALGQMNAMMMGGGKQEMCPALSSSTRALAPVMCMRDLPFVCEFDRFPPEPPPPPKIEQKKKKQKEAVNVVNKKHDKSKSKDKDSTKKKNANKKEKPTPPPKKVQNKPKVKVDTVNKPKQKQGKTQNKRKRDEM